MLKVVKKGRTLIEDPGRVSVFYSRALGTDIPLVVEAPGVAIRLSSLVARDIASCAIKHHMLSLDELETLQKEVYRAISRAQAISRKTPVTTPDDNQAKGADTRGARPGAGQGSRLDRVRHERASGGRAAQRSGNGVLAESEQVSVNNRHERVMERARQAIERKPGHEHHLKQYLGIAFSLIFEPDKHRWRRYYYHAYACSDPAPSYHSLVRYHCEEVHYFYFEQTPVSAPVLDGAFERPSLAPLDTHEQNYSLEELIDG